MCWLAKFFCREVSLAGNDSGKSSLVREEGREKYQKAMSHNMVRV